mgnify:CR=1 FL=1
MNSTLACLRLDFYTIKPYRRSLYLLLGLGFVIGFVFNKSVSTFSSVLMMGLVIITSYPFSIGDKYGLDIFYATLSVNRRDVVTGRYLFVICLELIGIGFVSLMVWLLNRLFAAGIPFSEVMLTLSVLIAVNSVMTAFQYPIFFRLGYARSKAYSYIPFVLVFVVIGMLPTIMKTFRWSVDWAAVGQFLEAKPFLLIGVSAATGLLALAVSWLLSVKFYEERDL